MLGYVLALDTTARELQAAAKIPRSQVADPQAFELWAEGAGALSLVDGVEKQRGSTTDTIFSMPFLISHISIILTLKDGNLILTGTPEGVGPVKAGETITAGITRLVDISLPVKHR
eukprot:jgi/Mesen1/4964/ME000248S04244